MAIKKQTWRAWVIGEMAASALASERPATIQGLTSRGMFLRLSRREIIFLSSEAVPGPLTVNVEGERAFRQELSPGDVAHATPDLIHFEENGLQIDLLGARRWRPGPSPGLRAGGSPNQRAAEMARAVHAAAGEGGLGVWLPYFFQPPAAMAGEGDPWDDLRPALLDIQACVRQGELRGLGMRVLPFLGRGPGLTPSGDDFVVGLLLALNRWAHVLQPGEELGRVNRQIVAAAYRSTTTLSASLIACAAAGQADARLISAVDHLASGTGTQAQVVAELLAWGHSSGVDALVGMLVGVGTVTAYASETAP